MRSGADFDRHIPKGAQARSRVNLVGVHALFEQERSVRLSEDERHDLVRDNTRKLYMALTRAGQRVVLTYVGEPPEAMLQCLGSRARRRQSAARFPARPHGEQPTRHLGRARLSDAGSVVCCQRSALPVTSRGGAVRRVGALNVLRKPISNATRPVFRHSTP